MASKKGKTKKSLDQIDAFNESIVAESSSTETVFDEFPEDIIYYNFFAALHLLEKRYNTRFGETNHPSEDPILLGQSPHISFAPTALDKIVKAKKTDSKCLNVFFFGLFGPNGPLPYHLTEEVFVKLRKKEREPAQDFFNIFHHRLISLFYRAWANKEPTAQLNRNGNDNFQFYLGSIAGYGLPSLRGRDTFDDYSKAHFAGYLGGKIRHSEGLENIILQLYGIQADIIEFVGEWLSIEAEHQCSLREGRYARRLGVDTSLGQNSWQSQYKFQIQLGPLTLNEYESTLPGSKQLKLINETIKNYMRDEIQWEIILLLKKAEVPTTKIGKYGRLGWTSWLKAESISNEVKAPSPSQITSKVKDDFVGNIRLHCEQIF